ncbi:MAG: sigma-70 family RNA polymerase sigma factor [Planctomycetaceae bacterium]|nr:sigma-70 family RNA polymerase sigma factor [Planctomycetales bacterium]MCB9874904.1 sigma-70 family RNA polymerase sigma factor [Planctomycetaceae bacterium]MCB9939171.1 sigma-70 family RNA polymerase sigma factor [Planctomycetaceae bacterium]HRX77772.1 sigma-70 family RNA polymerase sigma factor [Pirellulaceae bacterium]
MSETSTSLLDCLREGTDDEAWQRLVTVYSPLIRNWLRRYSTAEHDADDLVQDVLTVVVRRMPEFERQPRVGAFRCWLRTITVNCLRDFWRAKRIRPRATGDSNFQQVLDQLADPDSGMSHLWDEEHDKLVTERLLELIKPHFNEKTWRAFKAVTIQEKTAEETATELGMTVNAVFIAKSRVLSRLRQEGRGLID